MCVVPNYQGQGKVSDTETSPRFVPPGKVLIGAPGGPHMPGTEVTQELLDAGDLIPYEQFASE